MNPHPPYRPFANRREAGVELASHLRTYAGRKDVIVLALPRGGSATSPKSFEDAIVQGIARASETLRDVKSAWVKEQEAEVKDGKVVGDKVNLKVTFVLDGHPA